MEEKKMDGWKVAKVVGNMTASICVGHLVGTAIKPLIQAQELIVLPHHSLYLLLPWRFLLAEQVANSTYSTTKCRLESV